MDLQILTWTGTQGSFSFDSIKEVTGIDKLKQAVVIEFMTASEGLVVSGGGAGSLFNEVRSEAAAALADEVVARTFNNIRSNQLDVIRPDERLLDLELESFTTQSQGGYAVVLRITSEDGTETTTTTSV